jgi:predicted nuclease of predicted toxin-antitoxin system
VLRFVADENFNNNVVRGLRRKNPAVDIVRVQDVGLYSAKDPAILAWAARERRILLTHDSATMRDFAYERMAAGLPMSGLIEVKKTAPVGKVIEDLLLVAECTLDEEWEGRVERLPLRLK